MTNLFQLQQELESKLAELEPAYIGFRFATHSKCVEIRSDHRWEVLDQGSPLAMAVGAVAGQLGDEGWLSQDTTRGLRRAPPWPIDIRIGSVA